MLWPQFWPEAASNADKRQKEFIMGQATGTTDTFDLVGLAEDVEDIINNISPTDTPLYTMAKKKKATAVLHQWQTDALAAAAANRAIEGDDSTYATASPTVMLSNYCQIAKKTVMVSGTADAVRKYGRKEEFAYQIAKRGKEIKRDIEFALVQNQVSSAGSSSVARSSAGIEAMITNRVLGTGNSTGTTPGYAAGVWGTVTDGTAATMVEANLQDALQAAWEDGGTTSTIMVNAGLKRRIASFAGASTFAGVSVNQGRSAQGVIVGGVDLYVSDYGDHKIQLNRYQRAGTVLCLDGDYVSVAMLRPMKFEERAKTGDATRGELLCEFALVADSPDAHAKVQSVS
jgi:hypothetical protein